MRRILDFIFDTRGAFVAITPVGTSSPLRYSECLEIRKAYPKGSVTIMWVGGEDA